MSVLIDSRTKNLISWLNSPDALEAIEREKGRRDFATWLYQVSPDWQWQWRHLALIREKLQGVTDGRIKRLALFLHPRSGKSEMTTIRYPVWRLERDPTLRVIVGAYNQTLASKFSRKARRIARQRMTLNDERAAADDWETAQGGGVRAVGVGTGITGEGGHLIVIDDPVKSREEANSEAYRERCWEWYTDDLYTRLEPGGAIVLIMTRWGEDDLAGRILASQDGPNWTVVRLPAEAETQGERDEFNAKIGVRAGQKDPLGREPGEAMCPERYPLPVLRSIQATLGNSYYALYQQRPTAAEGNMFKRAWFEVVEVVPASTEGVRYWDKAGTAGGGAYTAGVLLSYANGVFYIEDVVRGQWAAAERERIIKQTAERDGRGVRVWVEQEPGSGGKESAEATICNLADFSVRADRPTGDKATRAEPVAAQAEAGNVKVLRGRWNGPFLEELAGFPHGAHKDQVDALSGAFGKLTRRGWVRGSAG